MLAFESPDILSAQTALYSASLGGWERCSGSLSFSRNNLVQIAEMPLSVTNTFSEKVLYVHGQFSSIDN